MAKHRRSLQTNFSNLHRFFKHSAFLKGLKKGICIFRYPFLYFYILAPHYICDYESPKNKIHSTANSTDAAHNRNEFIAFLFYLTLT
jgi:hypothetical protein